jgi:hypothetical protein
MMTYDDVNDLEEIARKCVNAIPPKTDQFNFCIAAKLSANVINDSPLSDVTDSALKWQAKECPKDLPFNHGMHIKNGIEHIISELNSKPSSNRALYSLLNQELISKSGDNPIPSFAIMQCGLKNNELYCTVYFRALEVANFLRINLEEIRLTIKEIIKTHIDTNIVNLTIFAFRAYNNPEQIPLHRARLDMLCSLELSDSFEQNPTSICELLEEKARETTFIELDGLYAIQQWLSPSRGARRPKKINPELILKQIDNAIQTGKKLIELRKMHSHHQQITEFSTKYVDAIKSAEDEFKKCLD